MCCGVFYRVVSRCYWFEISVEMEIKKVYPETPCGGVVHIYAKDEFLPLVGLRSLDPGERWIEGDATAKVVPVTPAWPRAGVSL